MVLGLDTATAATAAALRLADGTVLERRDDPPPGAHPGHATRLLAMIAELLLDAGSSWQEIGRIAVGVGPGTFTGLRVGVATARGLAHSRGIELVGVSSLQALALGALEGPPGEYAGVPPEVALAVIDARRAEVFAAAYEPGPAGVPRQLTAPAALVPEQLPALVAGTRGVGTREAGTREVGEHEGVAQEAEQGAGRWLLVGDGAVRYRALLTGAGLEVAEEGSRVHLVAAAAICELGAAARRGAGGTLPEYVRRPDAELALEGA
ncbi:MAG TPA: tRNA (adenosine(37)-N6)-threonylcarbamoyltransferase complex dimerization subunit type 1 TsaB [Solirubrobacteraceae bacterium]|nr:tRNA (adenosine(37)-N6)-threonylcarbamoyltransferase complex dimerization subunit type 1 TsaB [Solirubrobacteraceae bacterium]